MSDNENTLTTTELHDARTFEDLCEVAEKMGYKRQFGQLICRNGASVSSAMDFFEDNPGALEAVFNWIEEEYSSTLEENDEAAAEEEEEGNDEDLGNTDAGWEERKARKEGSE